jgi:predicted metal-dependent phosphoesterase TrpH
MRKFDLHLHTTASDGSDTPSELIALAKEAGLTVISVTDHDTLAGCIEAIRIPQSEVRIVTGIEFSCHHLGEEDFDCHILGYGFDPESPELLRAIAHGRAMRLEKLELRLKYLDERHGITFDKDELDWLRSLNSAARPHLARLLIKRGLADSVADAIDRYLKGDGFPDDRIDTGEAISAIISAGGIPVYAHPIGGEREERLTIPELEVRVRALIPLGLGGLECYYSRYSALDEKLLIDFAKSYGLLVSAGSDYHGRNKTVELARLCSDAYTDAPEATVITRLIGE